MVSGWCGVDGVDGEVAGEKSLMTTRSYSI